MTSEYMLPQKEWRIARHIMNIY